MANTKSAAKAAKQSQKKRKHNLTWKKKIKDGLKLIKKALESKATADILKAQLSGLQKVVDKAAKSRVIHANKANRIKTKIAKKIAAYASNTGKQPKRKSVSVKS